MAKIGVLAENWTVFKRYIKENELNPNEYDYIASNLSLRGRRGSIIALGMWWRNPVYKGEFLRDLEVSIACSRTAVKHRIMQKESL